MQSSNCPLTKVVNDKSEDLYRTLAKNFPNGAVLLFDHNLRYMVAEGVELQVIGLRSELIEGKTLWDVFSPSVCEAFEPAYRAALAGQTRVWEYSYCDRTYQVHTLPVTNDQGTITAGMVMTQNITAAKQAEAALRQQAERERLLGRMRERIRSSLNLDYVLNTAVTEVREFLQTDRVLFYRYQPDNWEVVVESIADGWTPIRGTELQDTCFVDDYVERYKQGWIQQLEDISKSGLKHCQVDLLTSFQVKASLVVPVLQGEKLWGLLFAHHCQGTRVWQESEVELLRQLSVQVAIALHQAKLYQNLKAELVERKLAELALRQFQEQLQKRSQQLEEALYELSSTQSHLIQTEKMSSLGQLVAGIAHEINNPVSFICGNIVHASRYAQDLLELVQLYAQYYPQPPIEIQSKAEAIDLDFLIEDFPKLLRSMKVGVDRIQQIVLSLRNFSRLDEAERKPVDIHEGIENTLLILQHRLKQPEGEIQLVKDYANLPPVECYPGQLNQVFMNLLSNAIDAIEESLGQRQKPTISSEQKILDFKQKTTPTIRISTELKDQNQIVIRIADTGKGIPEQLKSRIFDPFFTTKPVGKGTGLGLSISYQIVVDKHGGQLQCFSTPEEGTEFVIEVPLKATNYQPRKLPEVKANYARLVS